MNIMKSILFIFSILLIFSLFVNCQDTPTPLQFPEFESNSYSTFVSYNNYVNGLTFAHKEYYHLDENENFLIWEMGEDIIYNDLINKSSNYFKDGVWYNYSAPKYILPSSFYLTLDKLNYSFSGNTSDRGFQCSTFKAQNKDSIVEPHSFVSKFELESDIVKQNIIDSSVDKCFNSTKDENLLTASFVCSYKEDAKEIECEISYTYAEQNSSESITCRFKDLTNTTVESFGNVKSGRESDSYNVTIDIDFTASANFYGNTPISLKVKGAEVVLGESKDINLEISFVGWQNFKLPSTIVKPDCAISKNCGQLPSDQEPNGSLPSKVLTPAQEPLNLDVPLFSALFERVVDGALEKVTQWYHDDNAANGDSFEVTQTNGEIYIKGGEHNINIDTFSLSCNENKIPPTEMIVDLVTQILMNLSSVPAQGEKWSLGERTERRAVEVDVWTTTTADNLQVTLYTFASGWSFFGRHGLNSTAKNIPLAIKIEGSGKATIEDDIFLYDYAPVPSKITNFPVESCVPTLTNTYSTMVTMNDLKHGYTQQYQEIHSSADEITFTVGKFYSSDMVSVATNSTKTVKQWGTNHKCREITKVDNTILSLYQSSVGQQMSSALYHPTLSMSYKTNGQWVGTNSSHVITFNWLIADNVQTPINSTIELIVENQETNTLEKTFEFNSFNPTFSVSDIKIPTTCNTFEFENDDLKTNNLVNEDDEDDKDEDSEDDEDDDDDDELHGPKSTTKDYVLPTIKLDASSYPPLSNNFTINIEITTTFENGTISSQGNVVWKYSKDKLAESFYYTNTSELIEICFTDVSMSVANVTKGGVTNGPLPKQQFTKYFIRDGLLSKLFTDPNYQKQFTVSQNYSVADNGLKVLKLEQQSTNNIITTFYYPAGWTFETISNPTIQPPLLITKFNTVDNTTETWNIIKYDNTVDSDLYSKCTPPKKNNTILGISKNGAIAVIIIVAVVVIGAGVIAFVVIKRKGGFGKKQPAHILLDDQLVNQNDLNRQYEN